MAHFYQLIPFMRQCRNNHCDQDIVKALHFNTIYWKLREYTRLLNRAELTWSKIYVWTSIFPHLGWTLNWDFPLRNPFRKFRKKRGNMILTTQDPRYHTGGKDCLKVGVNSFQWALGHSHSPGTRVLHPESLTCKSCSCCQTDGESAYRCVNPLIILLQSIAGASGSSKRGNGREKV